jgi:hypothetical protein
METVLLGIVEHLSGAWNSCVQLFATMLRHNGQLHYAAIPITYQTQLSLIQIKRMMNGLGNYNGNKNENLSLSIAAKSIKIKLKNRYRCLNEKFVIITDLARVQKCCGSSDVP